MFGPWHFGIDFLRSHGCNCVAVARHRGAGQAGLGLQTLIDAGLRQKDSPDPFLDESECDRVIELVEAIGRDPSFTHLPNSTAAVPQPAPEDARQQRPNRLAMIGIGADGFVVESPEVLFFFFS